jgi:hypothetical protein
VILSLFLHHVQAVRVHVPEEMDAVLLDALAGLAIPAARALPAEPPPELVDGHVVPLLPALLRGQMEGRGEARRPASEDVDVLAIGAL